MDKSLICLIRLYLECSQYEIFQVTGISYVLLDQIEKEQVPPPKSLIDFYAKKLDVDSSRLNALTKFDGKGFAFNAFNKILTFYFSIIINLRCYEK